MCQAKCQVNEISNCYFFLAIVSTRSSETAGSTLMGGGDYPATTQQKTHKNTFASGFELPVKAKTSESTLQTAITDSLPTRVGVFNRRGQRGQMPNRATALYPCGFPAHVGDVGKLKTTVGNVGNCVHCRPLRIKLHSGGHKKGHNPTAWGHIGGWLQQ